MDYITNMYDYIKNLIFTEEKKNFKKPDSYKSINSSSIKLSK